MKVSADKIEGSQVVLNIEVDAEEMENAIKKAYHRLGAKTTVPGFRKGKAPPEMFERYFGRDALVEDAAEHLLPEVYDQAIQEHEVDAIAQPQIDVLQIDPLSFKATVPVKPTIELDDYHQIKFEREQVVMTEEEVAEALERIRYIQAPWEPVERPAKLGDLLAIDVEGTVDGEVVIEEKEGWYQLSPDLPNALPGFAEQLEGAEKAEERVFMLTLPEERGELGGKECNFKVLVNEIKEKKLAELDDDFAKSLGQGLETLDALKEKVTAELKSRKESEARSDLEEKAIKALIDLAQAEFPDIMVQDEIDHLISERERYFGDKQRLESYLNSLKKTQEEFRSELRPMAERIVLRSLVLLKFAELEGIEVSDADIDAEVEHMMQHTSDEGLRGLFNSPSAKESLRKNLFIRKALDRLVEIATGEKAPATAEEKSTVLPAKEEGDENGDAA
jgi:trigger factor